ncbi:hypothetical protein M0802_000780 [Mischocyttarus mexicanus]|nr:hypothetical protein M0802_000780 [Mischocyttarus mexicanus]
MEEDEEEEEEEEEEKERGRKCITSAEKQAQNVIVEIFTLRTSRPNGYEDYDDGDDEEEEEEEENGNYDYFRRNRKKEIKRKNGIKKKKKASSFPPYPVLRLETSNPALLFHLSRKKGEKKKKKIAWIGDGVTILSYFRMTGLGLLPRLRARGYPFTPTPYLIPSPTPLPATNAIFPGARNQMRDPTTIAKFHVTTTRLLTPTKFYWNSCGPAGITDSFPSTEAYRPFQSVDIVPMVQGIRVL